MPATLLSAAERRRSLAAAICCTSVVGTATGLTWPLLALVLDAQGVDSSLIGLSSATQALAIVAVSPAAPRLVARLGLTRTMAFCIAGAVVAFLLLALRTDVYIWFPIRFLLGASTAVLFIAGETWVSEIAVERSRGQVIGIFGFLWGAGFAAGPLVLRLVGIDGWPPFLVGIGIVLVSSLPLAFAGGVAPAITGRATAGPIRFIRMAPAALLATVLLGVIDAVNDTFLPLYGLRSGLSRESSVTLLTVVLVGVTAAQLPLGWLADHVDRRRLLAGTTAMTLIASAALPVAIQHPYLAWATVAVFGAAVGGIWTLSLVIVGERFRGAELAAVNTARGVLYGLGSIAGPPLAGAIADAWTVHGIPLVVAAACLIYLPATLIRERRNTPSGTV